MKKKVLILGVASVQMDAINTLKEMGHETYACAMAKDGPGADAADHFEIINVLDEDRLAEYITKEKIDVVYSTGSDLAMPIACRLSERLGLSSFVSQQVAYICNHKNLMRQTLTNECQGNIPYQVMDEIKEVTVPFPCIMKPSDAQGQRGIFLVNSQEEVNRDFEAAKALSRDKKVIIEKYISGPEISVNGYMVDKKLVFLVASDRITWPQFTGLIHKHIVKAKTIDEQTLDKLKLVVVDACQRVGIYNGPIYFQIKVEEKTPYIIEMTPRLDGCHMWNVLNHNTNVNLMKLTFSHLLDNDTSELSKEKNTKESHELVFFCQEPNTRMDQSKFEIPKMAIYSYFYYNTGDNIRPVNGKFEKIGYYINKLD